MTNETTGEYAEPTADELKVLRRELMKVLGAFFAERGVHPATAAILLTAVTGSLLASNSTPAEMDANLENVVKVLVQHAHGLSEWQPLWQ